MLLQSALIGKACEVHPALSVEQSSDYDLVKREILQAYKLVPEAYCQRFRDAKCQDNQTYMEFARDKRPCLISGVPRSKLVITMASLGN